MNWWDEPCTNAFTGPVVHLGASKHEKSPYQALAGPVLFFCAYRAYRYFLNIKPQWFVARAIEPKQCLTPFMEWGDEK